MVVHIMAFSKKSCKPCEAVKPLIMELRNRGLQVTWFDIFEDGDATELAEISVVPTVVATTESGAIISRLEGSAAIVAGLAAWSAPFLPTIAERDDF